MASIPVHNPQLPFLGMIPGGVRSQVMIRFRGVVHSNGRLQINIQCGPATEPRDDVALHLSIRPQESALVRNSYQNRSWGPEERYGHSPIYFGQQFDLLVLSEYNQFKIAINGTHFCTFAYRIPIERIKFVSVHGEGSISMIGIESDNAIGPTAPSAPSYHGQLPQVCPMPGIPPYPSHPPIGMPGMAPHGGVPVYPVLPVAPPPPYTPSPYPGGNIATNVNSYPSPYPPGGNIATNVNSYPSPYPPGGNIATNVTSYPSHDPMRYTTSNQQKGPKGIINQAKSMINNVIGTKPYTPTPGYPSTNPYQTHPQSVPYASGTPGYPTQPGQQYFPSGPNIAPGYHGKSNNTNKGMLAGLGGGTAALLTGAALYGKKKKLKKNKALKYAAGAGALGVGGYALHKAFKRRSSSSSSSSSSD